MPEPDTENKDWPEVELYRSARFEKSALYVVPDHAGLFRRSETYLPLQVIRERLQGLLDGEAMLYVAASRDDDKEGMDSHGAACDVLRAALTAFPQREEP